MTIDRLITLMVGRTIDQIYPPPRRCGPAGHAGPRGARASASPASSRTSRFDVQPGEVLGVSGLMGSGRSELARILFGLDPGYAAGTIRVDGAPLARADAAGARWTGHRLPHRGPARARG